MNVRIVCLFALTVGFPIASSAQSSDAKYCSALSDKYTNYAQDNGGKTHNAPPADVAAAMSKCSSDPASSIPVLEHALNAAKVSLPAR